MSRQQKVYFTRKRRRDEENEKQVNQQKSNTTSMAVTEIEPISFHTKLTDVNYDCLEKVFMHLSLDDLLNIAHTNTQLKPAADMVFAHKFAKLEIVFNIVSKLRTQHSTPQINEYSIVISDVKTSLRLLRCYGYLISTLKIGNFFSTNNCLRWGGCKIIDYANKYSSESLSSVEFHNITAGAFCCLEKPFSNVRSVQFDHCAMVGKLTMLHRWFPKIHNLELNGDVFSAKCLEAHFPNLQNFTMRQFDNNSFASAIMNMLRLNPQLQILHLDVNSWVTILQCTNQSLSMLERLHIECNKEDFCNSDTIVVNFDKLRKLHIDFYDGVDDPLPKIPISSKQLDEFAYTFNNCLMVDNLVDFLMENLTITTLNLTRRWDYEILSHEDSIKTATVLAQLPLLQKINFDGIELSIDKAILFTTNCKSLKTFGFLMTDQAELNRLKVILGVEWKTTTDCHHVKLERHPDQSGQ